MGTTTRRAGVRTRVRAPKSHDVKAPFGAHDGATVESAYCAEVVAVTYEDMGLLPRNRRAQHRRPSWYDPGRFWSGDGLELAEGYALGGEIAVSLPS